jgi:hypothetical protein
MSHPLLPRTLLAGILLLGAVRPGAALVEIQEVTRDYLREHSKELSLEVTRRKDGMVEFSVLRTVPEPRYFVARLVVKREGRTVAETTLPSLGQKEANRFAFTLAPELVADSEFRLDETSPAHPRTHVGYQFRLVDHVPAVLSKGYSAK